jgi:hypothetical protein
VPEVILDEPQVIAAIGEIGATSMAQHVRGIGGSSARLAATAMR